jgi:hypothetical protein
MEENEDMCPLSGNEISNSMEAKQDTDSLFDRTSECDLSIEEYLHFLRNALHIVDLSMRMKVSQQDIDEFFIEFYLKHENSYKRSEGFAAKLIFGSILPIFANSIFIDINKAKEWERNCEIDIEKYGMASGNGYAQEYYDKNKIIEYKYKSLLKIFSDPEIYAELRKQTLEPIELLLKKNKNMNFEKDKVSSKKDTTLCSILLENSVDVIGKINKRHSKLSAELIGILTLCENEVKLFSSLGKKPQVDNYNSLTARERVILTACRLYNEGFRGLPESRIARVIAMEYGGAEETFRKILKQLNNDNFNCAKLKTLKDLTEVLKKEANESNVRIANEKYKKITEFGIGSLRELMRKTKE